MSDASGTDTRIIDGDLFVRVGPVGGCAGCNLAISKARRLCVECESSFMDSGMSYPDWLMTQRIKQETAAGNYPP